MDYAYRIMTVAQAKRRRRKALALHWNGKSFSEIGEALSISRSRAQQLVHNEERNIVHNILVAQNYWMKKKGNQ